jgi:hypothetical protein
MATLDTNVKGATSSEIALTTETAITMYVFSKTGGEGQYRVLLEVSPDDGSTWVEIGGTLSKPGIHTCHCVATKARAKVAEAQGAVSTVTTHVLAR